MSTAVTIDRDEKGAPVCVIGARWPLRFYVTTGEDILATADAALGATSISVRTRSGAGLTIALGSGSKVRFGNLVVTLSADAAIGATALAVTATTGAIKAQQVGKAVVNVTGYTLSWVLRLNIDDSSAVLTVAGSLTTATDGVVDVVVSRAQSLLIAAGSYYFALSRTDSGSEALLAAGPLQVYELASR